VALAQELGLLDTRVFFNDWVPYAERWRYLVEADIGLSTHRDHLETRLSFRTRMLDYLWAGLPIVCTDGDHFASLVTDHELGLVVHPGDIDRLASAIERLVDDEDLRERCRVRLLELAHEYRWRRVVAPLAHFCGEPRFAPDRDDAQRRAPRGFRFARWAKRMALRLGVPETSLQRARTTMPARMAIDLLNRRPFTRAPRNITDRF
jgi:hypothetical protein